MSNKTKNNHYVPKFYLKKFLNECGVLFEKDFERNRILSRQNKDLNKVGARKNLYTVHEQQKITEEDIFHCERLFKLHNNIEKDIDFKYLRLFKDFLNDDIRALLKSKLGVFRHSNKHAEQKINDIFDKMDNTKSSRTQEDLYSFYENRFLEVYRKIIVDNGLNFQQEIEEPTEKLNYKLYNYLQLEAFVMNFIYRKALTVAFPKKNIKLDSSIGSSMIIANYDFFDFVGYMFVQYFRINKLITEIDTFLSRNVYFLYNHIVSNILANQFIDKGYKLVLIKNNTRIPFITSDVPIINIFAEVNIEEGVELFELYYPLSNNLAVLFTNKEGYLENNFEANHEQVKHFNQAMIYSSYRYIYCSNDELLRNIEK
ncbi:DUF4238 domain-containing protein [Francisella philomiragia]|uniref:DUF4238 domain-containing protein n=2 Tax=Francisella philomiragia TaxID=28110 RepID=UPI000B58F807|nr:DUF4238 domain-containing protein [Francisella philomiragia]MBK2095249.1 DUF4238 domain-containing protein [Francisella philomiragia]